MVNRDRNEIYALILQLCQEPCTRSKIIYKSLLNFYQVNAYVKILAKMRLLDYDARTRTFVTTSKGRKYVDLAYCISKLANNKPIAEREILKTWS